MTETVVSLLNQTIKKALEFADKNGTRKRHEDNPEWSCSEAGKFLALSNGTIDWKGPKDCDFGYTSIWEYCAGEYFGRGKKAMDKAAIARQRASDMENGVQHLRERLLQEHGLVLLVIPRTVNSQKIEVITLDPNYPVTTDPKNNQSLTAIAIQNQRDTKLVKGRMKASHQRFTGLRGPEASKQLLHQTLDEVTTTPLPQLIQAAAAMTAYPPLESAPAYCRTLFSTTPPHTG